MPIGIWCFMDKAPPIYMFILIETCLDEMVRKSLLIITAQKRL